MLELLNLLNAASLGALVLTDINLTSAIKIEPQQLHAVVQMEANPVVPLWSSERHCKYYGLVVPYERDWEIRTEEPFTHKVSINPPAPGKLYGYAILINKKACPGKEPEHLFHAGERNVVTYDYGIRESNPFRVTVANSPDSQPKWLEQVLKVIKDAEPTNQAAKDFLAFSESSAPKGKKDDTQSSKDEQTKTAD